MQQPGDDQLAVRPQKQGGVFAAAPPSSLFKTPKQSAILIDDPIID